MAAHAVAEHSSSLLAHLRGSVAQPPPISDQESSTEYIKTECGLEEESPEDARVEITVSNSRCAAQMEHVGISVMYYCTKCGHNSDQLINVTEHLEVGCPVETADVTDTAIVEAAQRQAQQKWQAEHNDHDYVECQQLLIGETQDEEPEEASHERDPEETDPRRWHCKWCPYTPLYSQVDLEQHTKCHGGNAALACYACPKEVGPSSTEWHRVRSHLFFFHKVHFQLQCEHCGVVFRGHTDYNKHVSSHKHSCQWDFCKYSSLKAKDVAAHERCHAGIDGRKFCCYLCKYQNVQLSGKWGIMHSHLVSKHTGVIGARYTCSQCGKGFQELRKYKQHMPCWRMRKRQNDLAHCATVPEAKHIKGEKGGGKISCEEPAVRKSVRLAQKVKAEVLDEDNLFVTVDVGTEDGPGVFPVEEDSSRASDAPATITATPNDDSMIAMVTLVTAGTSKDLAPSNTDIATTTAVAMEKLTADQPCVAKTNENTLRKPTHRCHFCYKKFATEARLHRHTLHQHSEEAMQRVTCPVCGKDFRNQMQMRNHKREVHEGKRRSRSLRPKPHTWFICETCGYRTPEAARLRNHKLSTHEGILRYKCPHCQYCTNEKSDLYRHRWKHQPTKRYQCSECSYATNTRWVLVNHCLKQHGIELPRLRRNTTGYVQTSIQADAAASTQPDVQTGVQYVVQSDGETSVGLDVQGGVRRSAHTVVQSDGNQEAVLSDNVRVVYLQTDQAQQSPLALITVLSEESTQ